MKTHLVLWMLFALMLPLCAWAAEVRAPAWPQSCTLTAGASAAMVVPVTQAGNIVLTLAWKNGPLTARVITPSNSEIPVRLAASPMRVPITVPAAEVQKRPVYTLLLAVPATARLAAPVEVTLNYDGPATDPAVLQAFAANLPARRPVSATVSQALATRVQAEIAANTQRQATQTANFNQLLGTRLISSTKRVVTARGVPINPLQPGALPFEPVRLADLTLAQPARLVSAVPVRGIPGDIVTLKATNLVPAERWSPEYVQFHTAVHFTVNPNVTVPGVITAVSQDTDGSTLLQVCVPVAAATVTNGYDGTVAIKSETFAYTTNTMPFRWDPTPKPVIATVTPSQAATGNWVTLKGQNFAAASQVFFVTETGAEVLAEMRYVNAQELQAKVPALSSAPVTAARMLKVYVKSTVNGVVTNSNQAAFQLLPPPTITAFDRASGNPGESLLITGLGFQNPVVHIMQVAGGKDYIVRPAAGNWSASQIIVTLPEIPLTPIDGVPVNVTVDANGVRSAPKVFTIKPILEERVLTDITVRNFNPHQTVAFGKDQWNMLDNGQLRIERWADFLAPRWGTDSIVPTVALKFGWKLERVETAHATDVDGITGIANFWPATATTPNLETRIDWYVNHLHWQQTFVTYIIKGPKGLPYK